MNARSSLRAGLAVLVVLPVLASAGAALAQDVDDESSSTPPPNCVDFDDVDGDPWCVVDVIIELVVIDVPRIDERERLVELEAELAVVWYDERLDDGCDVHDAIFQGDAAREKLKTMWWPDVGFRRGIGARETANVAVTVSCEFVIYEERFLATISQDFTDLNDFPFDEHELTFTMLPFVHGNDIVRIATTTEFFDRLDGPDDDGQASDEDDEGKDPRRNNASSFEWQNDEWGLLRADDFDRAVIINPFFQPGFDYDFEIPDGQLDEFRQYFADPTDSKSYYGDPDGYRPSSTFTVAITRRSNFYVYNIVLPLVLIVAISWVVFWGNIGKMTLAERLGVSITSLLTVVAFDFLTGDSLPRLSYTTRLDVFYNFSYVFVALTVVVSIVSTRMERRTSSEHPTEHDDEQLPAARNAPTRLDWHSRWAFPLAYSCAVAVSLMGWLSRGESWL